MTARYKKGLDQLTMMLHFIKTRKELPPGAVVDFQLLILKKITKAEKSISRTKELIKKLRLEKANEGPTRDRSREIVGLIKRYEEKIEGYRYIIYIWKMYVESVVFCFCDKYAIKHFLYDENYNVKETAGFISGKKGLRSEVRLLKSAAQHDVRAVLCDLTNTLRHGDVCLLGSNDPYPIEVKTSEKLDRRGEKQLRNLRELVDFFSTDKAENFRGAGPVRRAALVTKERYNLEALNDCINRCYEEGSCIVSPESGVYYLAVTKFKDGVLADLSGKIVHMVNLNEYKSKLAWHPYTPFHLSLNPEHLYNFISGALNISVFLDMQEIKRRFKKNGLHVTFLEEEHWYAQISANGNMLEGGFRVSAQSFMRVAFEFQNMGWAIKQHKEHLKLFTEQKDMLGRVMEIPPAWIDATDSIPI